MVIPIAFYLKLLIIRKICNHAIKISAYIIIILFFMIIYNITSGTYN